MGGRPAAADETTPGAIMLRFFKRQRRALKAERASTDLGRQVLDLQAELEAAGRKLAIANAEIESLAIVIARDRDRVKAERAEANLRIAQAEGKQANGK